MVSACLTCIRFYIIEIVSAEELFCKIQIDLQITVVTPVGIGPGEWNRE
jgi:hypothetical protein